MTDWLADPAALWLGGGLALAIAELLAPGFFLVFMAVGALCTGLIALVVPGTPMLLQVILFAALTAAAVAIGRRWYRTSPVPSADPLLNDRTARLIGQTVEVCAPIGPDQAGRVRVGDGVWSARGEPAAAGEQVRIVGAEDTMLIVTRL